jgi:hypothetical protein
MEYKSCCIEVLQEVYHSKRVRYLNDMSHKKQRECVFYCLKTEQCGR